MSLINDMLKDLEARGGNAPANGATAVRATAAGHAPADSRRGLVMWLLGTIVVLALVAGGLAYLLWPPAGSRAVETPPAVALLNRPASEPAPASVQPAPEIPPATIPPAVTAANAPDEPATAIDTQVPAPVVAETTVITKESAPAAPAAANVTDDSEQVLIVRRHEPTPEQKARRAALEGFAALRRGDWATAARFLQELVALEPASDDAREGLAIALTRQGRLAEADGVLLDGFAVAVEPARFAKLRARLQAARGERDAALESLSVAVPPLADDPEYHALKAALAQQAGQYALAEETYRALTAFEPANGTWQAGLGMALEQNGKPEEAYAAFERAQQAGGLEPALQEHVTRRLEALGNDKQGESITSNEAM